VYFSSFLLGILGLFIIKKKLAMILKKTLRRLQNEANDIVVTNLFQLKGSPRNNQVVPTL
jgi:hypothetical protein